MAFETDLEGRRQAPKPHFSTLTPSHPLYLAAFVVLERPLELSDSQILESTKISAL